MKTQVEIVKLNLENYGHSLDINYLLKTIDSLSYAEFEAIICHLLESSDQKTIKVTCLAIRNSIVYGDSHPELQEFVSKYPKSLIVEALEDLLYSRDRRNIGQALVTLGKTCSYSSLPAFNLAFLRWRDSDPLLIPQLLGEMIWLGLDNFWQLIDSMMTSPVYFTRWAVISLLPTFIQDGGQEKHILSQNKYQHLEDLAKDDNEFIKAEVEYKYKILEFEMLANKLSQPEREQTRQQLDHRYKSILSFEQLSIAFENYLASKDLGTYTINELNTFTNHFYYFHQFYRNFNW